MLPPKTLSIALIVLLVAPAEAQVQHRVRPHPTIFVCADDKAPFTQLQGALSSSYLVVDGTTAPAPRDTNNVTLAFFGRVGGTAEACVLRYPDGRSMLDRFIADDGSDAAGLESRLKALGAKVVGPTVTVQHTSRDLEGGEHMGWFADMCFLPRGEECPDRESTSILISMALDR